MNAFDKARDFKMWQVVLLGACSYLVLGYLAVLYYKERTILLDVAYRFYEILKDGSFAIQVNRFGSLFTQSFIFFGYHLALPLKYIMIAYSLSFIIYNALIFYLLAAWQKNKDLALLLLLSKLLFLAFTFYWIQSELLEGISFTIFYFGTLRHYINKKYKLKFQLLLFSMLITIVFFHPILIVVFLFITAFEWIHQDNPRYKQYLLAGIPLALLLYLIKVVFFRSAYDNASMSSLKNILNYFPAYWEMPSISFFGINLVQYYYFYLLLLIVVVCYLFQYKNKRLFYLVVIFILGYTSLILVSFANNNANWHMESFYCPLGVFVLLPFVQLIVPKMKFKSGIFCVFFVVKIGLLLQVASLFTHKLNNKRKLLSQTATLDHKKLLIDTKDVSTILYDKAWAAPFEFWLLSALEMKEQRSVVLYDSLPQIQQWDNLKKRNAFVTIWGSTDYKKFDVRYFELNDSSAYSFYTPINQ